MLKSIDMKPRPSSAYSELNASLSKTVGLQGASADLFYYDNTPIVASIPSLSVTQSSLTSQESPPLMSSDYHSTSSVGKAIGRTRVRTIAQPVQAQLPANASAVRKKGAQHRYAQQKRRFQRLMLVVLGGVLALFLCGLGLMQLAQWIVAYTMPQATQSASVAQMIVPQQNEQQAGTVVSLFTPTSPSAYSVNADSLFMPYRVTGVVKGEPLNAVDVRMNQAALTSVDAWFSRGLHWPYSGVAPAPLTPLPLPAETTNVVLQQTLNEMAGQLSMAFKPHVLFYDPFSNTHADINATDAVPSASVIKLPLLYLYGLHLAAGTMHPAQPILLEERHRVEGSGIWIGRPEHSLFRVHETAANMIQSSDNVATEMMLEALGGVDKVNAQWAGLGYHQTRVRNQLPDKAGLNTISMQEMVQTLIGIQQHPVFQTGQTNVALMDILEHTRNRRLIPGLLPPKTRVFHKTGDIGKSLGESALVQLPDGRYYYLAMMIERPHNSAVAAEFIRQFSQRVYAYQVAHPVVANKALWASVHSVTKVASALQYKQGHALPSAVSRSPSIVASTVTDSNSTLVTPPPPEAVEVF